MYDKPVNIVNTEVKKIFTDLLFGNLLKNYRVKSDEFPNGVTSQENLDYKNALHLYNKILDYVRDLESNKELKKVLEGIKEFHEDYYLDDNEESTLTSEQANEHYKIDQFYNTMKASMDGFTIEGRLLKTELENETVEDFELLESNINKMYQVFLKKLKNQNKR